MGISGDCVVFMEKWRYLWCVDVTKPVTGTEGPKKPKDQPAHDLFWYQYVCSVKKDCYRNLMFLFHIFTLSLSWVSWNWIVFLKHRLQLLSNQLCQLSVKKSNWNCTKRLFNFKFSFRRKIKMNENLKQKNMFIKNNITVNKKKL